MCVCVNITTHTCVSMKALPIKVPLVKAQMKIFCPTAVTSCPRTHDMAVTGPLPSIKVGTALL